MANIMNLTPAQRVDMIQRGFNPVNPEHIERYLKGEQKISMQEAVERSAAIVGEDVMDRSLGSSKYAAAPPPGYERSEMEYNQGHFGYAGPNKYAPGTTTPNAGSQGERPFLNEENYGGTSKTITSEDLLSLRDIPNKTKMRSLNEVVNRGKSYATEYYNAFIRSLQDPSTKANVEVYKCLEKMLKQERIIKENYDAKALNAYRSSVRAITQKMYSQLKG